MRYAQVDQGRVIAVEMVIVGEGAAPYDPGPNAVAVPDGVVVAEGYRYDGQTFLPPALAVPSSVTNAQARAILLQMFRPDDPERALFNRVDDYLRQQRTAASALPETDPKRIEADTAWQFWEQANEFDRNGLLVNAIGAMFGLTAAEIDTLFITAARISA